MQKTGKKIITILFALRLTIQPGFSRLMAQFFRTGFTLLLSLGFIRLATLGFYPLYDPSESRYAEMARKMLETDNWVTPMIDYGIPFWGKPPMTIWLSACSLFALGINEFAVRLPSFLLGIGIVWCIFHLARSQRNVEMASNSTIILSSSVLFFVMSGTVAMDQCLTFGITLALTAFWLALQGKERHWGYVFFIGLSIGILAKGPITLVLTGFTIGLWTLFTGRWMEIWQRIPWISGCLVMVSITLPWFIIAEQRTPGFLEYFIIGEHWKRFTESGWKGDLYGVGRNHPQGMIWLYWLGAGFPWTLLAFKKFISALLARKASTDLVQIQDGGWHLFCVLWMLAPLAFFTFSANIIWTYALPSLPGLALLLGDSLKEPRKYLTPLAFIVPIAFSALVIAYHLPNITFFKSQEKIVSAYQQHAKAGEALIYVENLPASAQFYLGGNAKVVSKKSGLGKSLETSRDQFYVIQKKDFEQLAPARQAKLQQVYRYINFGLYQAISGP